MMKMRVNQAQKHLRKRSLSPVNRLMNMLPQQRQQLKEALKEDIAEQPIQDQEKIPNRKRSLGVASRFENMMKDIPKKDQD